jgi:general secretion pathway protein C
MIKRIFTGLNIVLITVSVYLAVGIFYRYLDLRLQKAPGVPTVQPKESGLKTDSGHPEAYYRPIIERNLFGLKATAKEPTKPALDVDSLQQTSLKLKLWGTVAGEGENDQKSYAVIEELTSHLQDLYHIGDSIQNATVKLILREKVVLTVNGKDEVLEMENPAFTAQGRMSGLQPAAMPSAPQESGALPAQKISLQRSLIEESIRDISSLMTQVKIMPHMEEGQPDGLSVSNIQPNSIFRRMGLRNGDILVGVDGQNIKSVDDALKLYDNLKTSDNVSVQIKRRGRVRNIDYNVR